MTPTLAAILRNAPPAPPIHRVPVIEPRVVSQEVYLRMLTLHIHSADPYHRPLGSQQ